VEGSFNDTKRTTFTGEDIRFTTKGDTLYAIALAWPGERLTIRSLGTASGLREQPITSVRLLGHDAPVAWTRTTEALLVEMPTQPPCEHAFVISIS
jgi:alpha-L-fucosidase